MQYNKIDEICSSIDIQLSILVACTACVVFGRTKENYKSFVKHMTILIILSEFSSYSWSHYKFSVGQN